VNILRKMELPRKMISQTNAVKSMEKFQKLRNIIAHQAFISNKDIDRIISDNELMKMFSDFPKSYTAEIRNTNIRISRLMHSYMARNSKAKNEKKLKD
jgi:hypothetical protein